MIDLFLSLICACLAGVLINLGLDWLVIGYGLNPWLSFPLACALTWASYDRISVVLDDWYQVIE